MRKCTNPGCPCICDDPDMHHELARLGGSAEVDPSCCARAEPTVPASEHQRMQAEAAAMRRALEHIQTALDTRYGEHPIGRSELRGATDSALLGSAGRALLEEMEGLRRANAAMAARLAPDWSRWIGPCVHGRDPWDRCDTCEEAGEAQSIVWVLDKERKEHAAESADLRARLEEAQDAYEAASAVVAELRARLEAVEKERADCITPDEALAQLGLIKQDHAAEVRRAVEAERASIVTMLGARASEWGADTAVGHALEVAAADIRARGKE